MNRINITKCFTSVIMEATKSIILEDMRGINMFRTIRTMKIKLVRVSRVYHMRDCLIPQQKLMSE